MQASSYFKVHSNWHLIWWWWTQEDTLFDTPWQDNSKLSTDETSTKWCHQEVSQPTRKLTTLGIKIPDENISVRGANWEHTGPLHLIQNIKSDNEFEHNGKKCWAGVVEGNLQLLFILVAHLFSTKSALTGPVCTCSRLQLKAEYESFKDLHSLKKLPTYFLFLLIFNRLHNQQKCSRARAWFLYFEK